jgi:dinuclear metal center YbgI/SA1388 family protein
MVFVREITAFMRQIAPEESAFSGDPVGLSIQFDSDVEAARVGVCLDITPEGAATAAELGVNFIISHHPLIFRPISKIDPSSDRVSQTIVALVSSKIALYSAHTNWDRASGGINDTLVTMLGLSDIAPLAETGDANLARIGSLSFPVLLSEFCETVKNVLECKDENELRYRVAEQDRMISRVAVCGGAGAGFMNDAVKAGADVFVTADVRHHEFLDAAAIGLPLLDAGHGATERPGMLALLKRLSEQFPTLETVWLG